MFASEHRTTGDRVIGIVVEYNPFHNGHAYHLEKARHLLGDAPIVAVMSGNFVQRGEPAIVDKWARCHMALCCGVDLVVELPVVFAIQDAGGFATGAVLCLERMGIVSDLVFGSESSDTATLGKIASVIRSAPPHYVQRLHSHLKEGHSFPNARKWALHDYFTQRETLSSSIPTLVSRSNDILGIEYLHALQKSSSSIRPHTVLRVGSAYNEAKLLGPISSATAIRKTIRQGALDKVRGKMPAACFEELQRAFRSGEGPCFLEELTSFFLTFFRSHTRDHLQKIHGIKEGLDTRLVESARMVPDLRSFLEAAKSKRFPFSRLRRILLHVLFEISGDFVLRSNWLGPQYIRVLGFNAVGQQLLARMRKKARVPVISVASRTAKGFQNHMKTREGGEWYNDYSLFAQQLELDFRVADFYRRTFFHHYEGHNERAFTADATHAPMRHEGTLPRKDEQLAHGKTPRTH